MASVYTNDLRLEEIGSGEQSGTWGDTTNTNLELIAEALSYDTEAITTNADTHTSTVADGAADAARAMYIKYTGTLDSACTITIAPNTISRVHFIENATSGSQNIIISQGSGANVTIPPGDTKAVYLDGAGSGAAVVDAFASLSVVDLKVQDDLTVTDDVTIGGDLTVNGDTITFTSANSSDPIIKLINTTNDTSGAELHIRKDKGAAGADGDIVGLISFIGDDATQQQHIFAKMEASIATAADGSEGGKLILGVATHDAEFQNGLVLQDGNAEDEIDVTIASGTSSITNIVGSLGVGIAAPDDKVHIKNTSGNTSLRIESDGSNTLSSVRFLNDAIDYASGVDTDDSFFIYDNTNSKSRLKLTASDTIFHDDSGDFDFRVESNVQANTFFIEGSTGNISMGSIGTPVPSASNYNSACFHISQSGSSNVGAQIRFTTGQTGHTASDGSFIAQWEDLNMYMTNQEAGGWRFFGNSVELLSIDHHNNGTVFNEGAENIDWRVEGDNFNDVLYVDAGTDTVGIRTTTVSSTAALSVHGDGSANYGGMVIRLTDSTNTNNGGVAIMGATKADPTVPWTGVGFWDQGTVRQLSYGGGGWGYEEATAHVFYTGSYGAGSLGAVNRLAIGSTGRVSLGTTSPVSPGTHNSRLSVEGTDYHSSTVGIAANSNNTNGAYLFFSKSRGTSVGATTVVQDGDTLGMIGFYGADGTDVATPAAAIYSQVNGTPSGNDMPGRLILATTADNADAISNRITIDQDGNVIVGYSGLLGGSTDDFMTVRNNNGSRGGIRIGNSVGTSNTTCIRFHNDNGVVGQIRTSGSATAYDTSSDYRLKENVVTDWDATSRLKQLKPSRFNFKADKDTTVDGFLAHEVSSIVPEAINGEKDATKKVTDVVLSSAGAVLAYNVKESAWVKGKTTYRDEIQNIDIAQLYPSDSTWVAEKDVPDYQSIDQSKLVPLLVKTIQELEARITALEGE